MACVAKIVAVGLAALALTACQTSGSSPYQVNGVAHTEPVEFNGQRYAVTFEYSDALSGYDIQVNRRSKPLTGGDGDRGNSIQVATSAITHFACASGQKARIVDGTAAFGAPTWRLQAKCS